MSLPQANLSNYHALIAKVDGLCDSIRSRYADQIVCRKGCAECCSHISHFPVEAVALARALMEMPSDHMKRFLNLADTTQTDGPCPLLADNTCLLYDARPLICRTHGMPILFASPEGPRLDFCPRNFQNVESLPGEAMLDLDQLNRILHAINQVFVEEFFTNSAPPERMTIAQALLLIKVQQAVSQGKENPPL